LGDTNFHPDVLNAYQALAIDERREAAGLKGDSQELE